MNKKMHCETFCSVKFKYETFCSNDTCVDYVIYPPKLENDTIKIGYFMHKCKFSTFIIVDGYRMRINRTSIKVIISLNLSASNTKTL